MKRVALFVILAYAVLFILLTWPVLLVAFYSPDKNLPNASQVLSTFKEPIYLIFILVVMLCQSGLLLIPVKIANSRPISKRSLYLPIIVSGFLMGALFLGMIWSLNEFIQKDSAFKNSWEVWSAIGFCVLIWIIWSIIFCRLTSGQEPKNIILKQCKYLLQGSVIALLVAVPMHIVVRNREYCCAGFCTFVGIAFGISVMLLSFGPSVYFLYAERWRRLHPKSISQEKES